ncbi:hypothetical protein DFA_03492 [Cavenderia fasciculata]|uniref:Uncharacterized protein n=1 Tax=Cavenderia fasciculata TaxID=261658 RepID=F4PHR0_CACFS|nr:uncharacterized protein DFA_03492 [Cavenderia fasciculata]EGG25244.1 hypothetical protein DFA_03492 [Cavenderia fasciculata]|eukprot:XP_004363095.1 hypothetical protein DFA_03492 [Cavenderia fasciculata]
MNEYLSLCVLMMEQPNTTTFLSVFRVGYIRRTILDHIPNLARQYARIRSRDRISQGKQEQSVYMSPDRCTKTYYNANNIKWLLVNGYESLLKDKYEAGHLFEADPLFSWMECCTEQARVPAPLIDKLIGAISWQEREKCIRKAIIGGNLVLLEKLLKLFSEDTTLTSMALIYDIASKCQNNPTFKEFINRTCAQHLARYIHHGRQLADITTQEHGTRICKMIVGVTPIGTNSLLRIPDSWILQINKDLIMSFDVKTLKYITDEVHLISFNVVALYDFVESVLCNPWTIQDQHINTIRDIWRLVMLRHQDIFNSRDSIEQRVIDKLQIDSRWSATTPKTNQPFTFKQLVDLFYFIDMITMCKIEYRTLDDNIATTIAFISSLTPPHSSKDTSTTNQAAFFVGVVDYVETFVPKSLINYVSVFGRSCLVCSVPAVVYFEQKMKTSSLLKAPIVYNDARVLEYVATKYTFQNETLEKILIESCTTDHVDMVGSIIHLFSETVIRLLDKLLVESARSDSLNTFLLLFETYPAQCVVILCNQPILVRIWKPSYFVLRHFNKIIHHFESTKCQWRPGVLNVFIELAIIFCNLPLIKRLLLLPKTKVPTDQFNVGYAVPYKPILDFFFDATMHPDGTYVCGTHFTLSFGNFCWAEATYANDPAKLDLLFQLNLLRAPGPYEQAFSVQNELQKTILPQAFKHGSVNLIQYCIDTYNIRVRDVFLKQDLIYKAITSNSLPIIKHLIKFIQSRAQAGDPEPRMYSMIIGTEKKKKAVIEQPPTLLEYMYDTANTLNQKEILKFLSLIRNNNKK